MADPKITLEEVEHVARLARLALGADEKERMRSQLDAILGYVEQLRAIDTRRRADRARPAARNVMRDDEVRPSYPAVGHARERSRRGAASSRVPRILEE